jgi:hypothetical protein
MEKGENRGLQIADCGMKKPEIPNPKSKIIGDALLS